MNKKASKFLNESLEGFRYCRKDAETSMKHSTAYYKIIVSHLDSIIAGLENSQEGLDYHLRASMDILREIISKYLWNFFMKRAVSHEKITEFVTARAFESAYLLSFFKYDIYMKYKDEPDYEEDKK